MFFYWLIWSLLHHLPYYRILGRDVAASWTSQLSWTSASTDASRNFDQLIRWMDGYACIYTRIHWSNPHFFCKVVSSCSVAMPACFSCRWWCLLLLLLPLAGVVACFILWYMHDDQAHQRFRVISSRINVQRSAERYGSLISLLIKYFIRFTLYVVWYFS